MLQQQQQKQNKHHESALPQKHKAKVTVTDMLGSKNCDPFGGLHYNMGPDVKDTRIPKKERRCDNPSHPKDS